ncbi:YfdX family protein [Methylobacterium sp. J-088]|uniref:YfdX family protein n=1 Tax=unclassified Methylobacterium TaxID=2615210 RepID=UPI001FBAD7AA|nr:MULTISPECIES: YfdX family protein [unclassified Methylobacterium]MCJ2063603.1 YfdX family protein [Methylobacterium sp. J-088]
MAYRKSMAAALVLSTILGGTAFAAEQAAQQPAAQQTAIDKDVGKLSKDGAQAFRDLQLTRLAIFEADPAQAKALIGKTQAAFTKAKTDDAVFTKAEADLKTPADMAGHKAMAPVATAQPATTDAKPSKEQVAWVPVDAQLTLGDDFVASPDKASAVTEANKNLAHGDQKGAIEKLKLAHVDVNFTMAVLPLDKTIADVNQAATLIGQGKYYEANAVLKTAQDGMRFDMIDAVALPQTGKAAASNTASPTATGTAAGAKAGK